MARYRETRNVQSLIPISYPLSLSQVPCPESFMKIPPFQTGGFHPYEAWVVASGFDEGFNYLIVLVTEHASSHYLVLVHRQPEQDWYYHDKAFFTNATVGKGTTEPLNYLVNNTDADELLGMFFAES